MSKQGDLNSFLAHECHHWIRNRHLAYDRSLAAEEDDPLLWVLDQLQAEGIADRIDKAGMIEGEVEPPPSRAAYMAEFLENLAAAPEHIRQLDTILSSGTSTESGENLRSTVPQSGHPTGYFMASRIVDFRGLPALVSSAGDPFAFVELYQLAALADPETTPAFSDQGLTVIRDLGQRIAIKADGTVS